MPSTQSVPKKRRFDIEESSFVSRAVRIRINEPTSPCHTPLQAPDTPISELDISGSDDFVMIDGHRHLKEGIDKGLEFEMIDHDQVDGQDIPSASGSRNGCLVLCCAKCMAIAAVSFNHGCIPPSLNISTTPNSNALCLTSCNTCSLEHGNHVTRWTQCGGACSFKRPSFGLTLSLWNDLDVTKAATYILGEEMSFAADGMSTRYITWRSVSAQTDEWDAVVSWDIDGFCGGRAEQIILPYLRANWI